MTGLEKMALRKLRSRPLKTSRYSGIEPVVSLKYLYLRGEFAAFRLMK